MADLHPTRPVKLFMAVLRRPEADPAELHRELAANWGPLDYVSPDYPFTRTDYYAAEMGPDLVRYLVSFGQLIAPQTIGDIKLATNVLEDRRAAAGQRSVNLDPGYLDYQKVVLASLKFGGQKICLRDGVYADLTLYYRKGSFTTFPWTFPDFKEPTYWPALRRIRELYKENLRALDLRSGG
ncbi:MAG: DUF4416 family protein [Acidobacteria bacterium]|nr:DUF4416 family protein [Acidobacteriota bacterium]